MTANAMSCAHMFDSKMDTVNAGEATTLCIQLSNDSGCPIDINAISDCEASAAPIPDSFFLETNSVQGPWKYHQQDCPLVVEDTKEVYASVTAEYLRCRGDDVVPCDVCHPSIVEVVRTVKGEASGFSFGYWVKAAYWQRHFAFQTRATLLDPSTGRFRVDIPAHAFKSPGVYLADFVWVNGSGERVGGEMRYLEVRPTLRHSNWGALTIPEIRMAIRDYPCSNHLLEDYEFSDHEIMFAIRRPIDEFNEMSPDIGLYDVTTFRWREHHLKCTIGLLMRTAAAAMRRNDMTYQATTLSVKDNDMHPVYEQTALTYIEEFKDWARRKKMEINLIRGWGVLRGPAYGDIFRGSW